MKQFSKKTKFQHSVSRAARWIWPIVFAAATLQPSRGESGEPSSVPAASTNQAPSVEKRWQYAAVHMGVAVRLTVYASDETKAQTACRAAFARVAEIDGIASDYRADSELMLLCRHFDTPLASPFPVSRELFEMLDFAASVSHRSGGAFDVSIGPLVALWRQSRRNHILPTKAAIRNARRLVDWRSIRLNRTHQSVQLLKAGMRLDLGGVAKGYAGDCALKVLCAHGVTRALFEAGGDIVVGDAPPNSDGWRIQLLEGRVVTLKNAAISTSGDSEQWVEIGGRHYSHVVDVRTGLGLTTRFAATVTAPSGLMSDALSTAASLIGPKRARDLSKYFGGTSFVVRRVVPPDSAVK